MLFGALLAVRASTYRMSVRSPSRRFTFNSNVQALVGVLNTVTNTEVPFPGESEHLRRGPKSPATPATPLDKLFLNDIVAMDADRRGKNFLVVSRGGNYVIRATLGADGLPTRSTPTNTRAVSRPATCRAAW